MRVDIGLEGKAKRTFCVITLLFVFGQSSTANNHETNCYNKVADIVFVLDSSNSIWLQDFNRQLHFVNTVINSFQIDKEHIQIGVLTFSNVVRLDFNLNQYQNKIQLKDAIHAIPYLSGGTETGKAIEFARENMFKEINGGRPSAAHYIVVITDGQSQDKTKTALEASIARNDGIIIFAIGVGQGAEVSELNRIASIPNSQYVFEVDGYSDLISIRDILAKRACEEPVNDEPVKLTEVPDITEEVKSYCSGKPADVYFVVDASSSIWRPDFEKQLNFVKNLIDEFDIGPNKTRVGVVAYSDGIHPTIFLNSYFNRAILKERVGNTPHLTGGTNTAAAIGYVRKHGFGEHIARHEVAHIMILLTDGQSDNRENAAEEARRAKEDGIYIFTIGVGDNIDVHEVRDLASDPDENFAFTVHDFDALSSLNNILAKQTCKVDPHPIEFPRDDQAKPTVSYVDNSERKPENGYVTKFKWYCFIRGVTDVVFMYDSNAVSGKHARIIRETISDMSVQMEGKTTDIRFGLLTNTCPDDIELLLRDYENVNDFNSKINLQTFPGFSSMLHKLRHRLFSVSHGARPHSQKLAILFIDDEIEDPKTLVAAHRAKFQGIHIFVVAIGKNVNERQVESLTSRPAEDHYIKLESYGELSIRTMDILKEVCSAL